MSHADATPEDYSPTRAARESEAVLRLLEGRWKLGRFSDLERQLRGVSQKMLLQQLRRLEADGLVTRNVPPNTVGYGLIAQGLALCPVLEVMSRWHSSAGNDRAS